MDKFINEYIDKKQEKPKNNTIAKPKKDKNRKGGSLWGEGCNPSKPSEYEGYALMLHPHNNT